MGTGETGSALGFAELKCFSFCNYCGSAEEDLRRDTCVAPIGSQMLRQRLQEISVPHTLIEGEGKSLPEKELISDFNTILATHQTTFQKQMKSK